MVEAKQDDLKFVHFIKVKNSFGLVDNLSIGKADFACLFRIVFHVTI